MEYTYGFKYFHKNIPTEYFVTPDGHVYSYKHGTLRELHPTRTGNGYLKVRLSIGGRVYNRNIHRIVAETYISNPENKPEVNHIDGNKHNNNVTNLEWATRKENAQHAYLHDLFGKGEQLARSSISDMKCHQICKLLEDPSLSYMKIAEMTGVSKRIVSSIAGKHTWKHISDNYDFSKRAFQKYISKTDAIHICKLLEQQHDIYEISKIVGCKPHIVKDIKRGRSWVDVAKKYKF